MIRIQTDNTGTKRIVHHTDIVEQSEGGKVSTLMLVYLNPKKRNKVMVLREPTKVLKFVNENHRIQEF